MFIVFFSYFRSLFIQNFSIVLQKGKKKINARKKLKRALFLFFWNSVECLFTYVDKKKKQESIFYKAGWDPSSNSSVVLWTSYINKPFHIGIFQHWHQRSQVTSTKLPPVCVCTLINKFVICKEVLIPLRTK